MPKIHFVAISSIAHSKGWIDYKNEKTLDFNLKTQMELLWGASLMCRDGK